MPAVNPSRIDSVAAGRLALKVRKIGAARLFSRLGGKPRRPGRPGRARPAEFLTQPFDLVKNAAPVFEQQLAGIGGGDTAPVAQQEVLAELHFQQAHLPAQRRWATSSVIEARVKLPSSAT